MWGVLYAAVLRAKFMGNVEMRGCKFKLQLGGSSYDYDYPLLFYDYPLSIAH